ncbi:PREDICTED: uncharacterized protein LOC18598817 [Theobroma cacao]|uniref:Uncharacterized protein LOC18598817 n=1 Tax=Theobroma cacao TaxID=3641 RepID=A0AB32V4F9_THECC|nr:PREDICTED: uncharacterized protein LOC18598817 [Theobroma cacao]
MKSFYVAMKSLHSPSKHRCIATAMKSSQRNKKLRRKKLKRLNASMRRLKVETNEIRKEQEIIKRGQREVREKFEAIHHECEQLRTETDLIIKQSLNTRLRLGLMFQILRARESNDFNKAASLTQLLRELVAKPNNQ